MKGKSRRDFFFFFWWRKKGEKENKGKGVNGMLMLRVKNLRVWILLLKFSFAAGSYAFWLLNVKTSVEL